MPFLVSSSQPPPVETNMANSSSSSDPPAFRPALERARNCEDGNIDAATTQILESAIADLWRRIQDQPDTYTLTRDEFALFNYFIKRFSGDRVAQDAVARYWNNIGQDTANSSTAKT
ncbi:hypothetical protein BDV59DRAFT_199542 [Aspergillus ambiguus]|uniref:uncharacterized protein n=1 Tax=Aspergillus ambiguus TaxID=176160 RepID=UPI003CCD10FE